MEFPAPHSQGLRSFLEVFATTIELRLESIRSANSDRELKSTLLALAQKGFQVWSLTGRWNEVSTSSRSHSSGSDAFSFTSWEQLPPSTPTGHMPLPKPPSSSAFPNMEQPNPQLASNATNSTSTGHAQPLVDPHNTPHGIPFPPSTLPLALIMQCLSRATTA